MTAACEKCSGTEVNVGSFVDRPPLTSQSPEEVIQMLIQAAGPGAGTPPADVVGTALRQAGVEITTDNVIRALKEVLFRTA
ncbi:hypothetical protein AK812_SmicGene34346 [Symbiodinium microadriaticum]|uniref:Uncharacterized protein n=1 Tax=Symbiodinium microadriaticum TaxID=2951 RepID=A0A1Q9CP93_SYMMI|nr:hypothetical protein AK812_SmicGene34346 [Symbiodinium microadriaticum]